MIIIGVVVVVVVELEVRGGGEEGRGGHESEGVREKVCMRVCALLLCPL